MEGASTHLAGGDAAVRPEPAEPAGPDRGWALLARVAAGDEAAMRELVERHQGRLLRLCERLLGDPEEARDAAQEVFLKLFRRAGRFEPRGRLYTLIYRIVANHCLNQLRRRRLVAFLPLARGAGGREEEAPELDPADPAADPATALAARRRWRAVRRAVAALPPSQRAVLVLVRFEGLSYKQTAAVLGITVGAVESRLFRALRGLERRLDQAQETPRPRVAEKGEDR